MGENLEDQPLIGLMGVSNLTANGTVPYATFPTASDIFGDLTATVAASTKAFLKD